MIRFLARRLVMSLFVLLVVVSATFFVLNLSGDPIAAVLQGTGASQEEIDALKHKLGYDRPIMVRYGEFLVSTVQGDFGTSIRFGQSSLSMVMERLPYTLALGAAAIAIILIVAIPLGVLSAVGKGGIFDKALAVIAGVGQSIPHFVIGPILILIFAVLLRWVPVSGAATPTSIILPAVTLSLYPLAMIARVLRASMLDTAEEDYIVTAHAKGLKPRTIVVRHMLRNALLPVLTIISLQFIAMIGGTIVVESIFGWPGLGSFARDALLASDFPLAQTIIIFVALAVVIVNLVSDIVYSIVDPRIRLN